MVLYGPLLDRGVPLRTIVEHTRSEILVWCKALERYGVLKNGASVAPLAKENRALSAEEMQMLNRYYEEMEKIDAGTGISQGPEANQ